MSVRYIIMSACCLALVTTVRAALVPRPFMDDPSIQRLTRNEAIEHWSSDMFGQCHGVAITRFPRRAEDDSMPLLFVCSDEAMDGILFGMGFDRGGSRGEDWAGFAGEYGLSGSGLYDPLGVAIDTFVYEGRSSQVHVYVACGRGRKLQRFTLDLSTHAMTYNDIVFSPTLGKLTDVSCAAATTSGSTAAYLAVVNEYTCRLDVLSVDASTMSVASCVGIGQHGSGQNQFDYPEGVCIVPGGTPGTYDVYVADMFNSRIVRLLFNPSTNELSWQAALSFQGAAVCDVTASPSGYVYAVDVTGDRLLVAEHNLSDSLYTYNASGFSQPREISVFGDELVVTERWGDSTGVQYLRIVPEIRDLEGQGFDATRDSTSLFFRIAELDAHADVTVVRNGSLVRTLASDTLLYAGQTTYAFAWRVNSGDTIKDY
jgi:hypothetical protein